MPIKFKQSAKTRDRATGKVKTEHYYIKCMSTAELFTELNNSSTKPKAKQKVRNELDRRGIKIEWVPKVV
mgnify:FL=1|tara:strand:- start:679 stop:888 length:210 start_codon:yes stop_codon:yes gene_type:complete